MMWCVTLQIFCNSQNHFLICSHPWRSWRDIYSWDTLIGPIIVYFELIVDICCGVSRPYSRTWHVPVRIGASFPALGIVDALATNTQILILRPAWIPVEEWPNPVRDPRLVPVKTEWNYPTLFEIHGEFLMRTEQLSSPGSGGFSPQTFRPSYRISHQLERDRTIYEEKGSDTVTYSLVRRLRSEYCSRLLLFNEWEQHWVIVKENMDQ